MKKYIQITSVLIVVLLLAGQSMAITPKEPESMPFYVYTENDSKHNHFVPSGGMGDHGAVRIDQDCKKSPYSGGTCIEIDYSGELTQGSGWVGFYWQNPENNWGSEDGGFNLSYAKKITFYARGKKGGEKLEFKIGGITGRYADSDMMGIGPVELTSEWQEYSIDLEGAELFYISGGFVFAASRMDNSDGFIIYLDEIKYDQ
jgi:hypothetical protein